MSNYQALNDANIKNEQSIVVMSSDQNKRLESYTIDLKQGLSQLQEASRLEKESTQRMKFDSSEPNFDCIVQDPAAKMDQSSDFQHQQSKP